MYQIALEGYIATYRTVDEPTDKEQAVIRIYVEPAFRKNRQGVYIEDNRHEMKFQVKFVSVYADEAGYRITPVIPDFQKRLVDIKLNNKALKYLDNAKKGFLKRGVLRLGGRSFARFTKASTPIN